MKLLPHLGQEMLILPLPRGTRSFCLQVGQMNTLYFLRSSRLGRFARLFFSFHQNCSSFWVSCCRAQAVTFLWRAMGHG